MRVSMYWFLQSDTEMIFPDEDEAWCNNRYVGLTCEAVVAVNKMYTFKVFSTFPQSIQDAVQYHDLYLKSETYEELKRFIKLVAFK